jgi:predicted RNA-binding Zn-ribbon protein involved in translation (DUF1610 family)
MAGPRVIDLAAAAAKKIAAETESTRLSGTARCISCERQWEAVAPTGTVWLECPACGLLRGRFVYPCERPDPHWICGCGNELFHMTPDGIYCPNCGEWQSGY